MSTREANVKDGPTVQLQSRLRGLSCAVETDEAAACLTALSFASRVCPERHVWVDTDLAGRTSLDLEDRLTETTWDNAVHRFKGLSEDRIVEVVEAWLSGSADGVFVPTNPWPDPEPDTEEPGRVWRSWILGVDGRADPAAAESMIGNRDVRVLSNVESQFVVRIRSDDPIQCDVHALMKFTRDVFERLENRWVLRTVQGIPKDKWLFLK